METRSYAYARVSSKDQNLERQLENLKKYVKDERDIYTDKKTGKNTDRPGLQSLLYAVRSGDTVYIHSLDRLGRNKEDILQLLSDFKSKGVIVRILDLPTSMTDYGEASNGIMELINSIIIEVMAYQAQAERENIKKRQEEGIAVAKAKGVHFGRESYEYPDSWKQDYTDWKAGKKTAVSIYKAYGWTRTTFYRKVKSYEANCIDN